MGDEAPKYTVEEAIAAMGFGKFQILVLAYAGMGWISEAMEMMLLSFVGPALQSAWDLSSNEESLITSVVFAGMLVGAYTWGIVSDKHGRRTPIRHVSSSNGWIRTHVHVAVQQYQLCGKGLRGY
ncbi:organic cation/carnitine transporter 7 [Quercus suber]|uniref:Organic cation/carnitine transporter 7 n=1 Tax=Quercus suber TaxID=58331 RepID=A0AAW0IL74_QUESU